MKQLNASPIKRTAALAAAALALGVGGKTPQAFADPVAAPVAAPQGAAPLDPKTAAALMAAPQVKAFAMKVAHAYYTDACVVYQRWHFAPEEQAAWDSVAGFTFVPKAEATDGDLQGALKVAADPGNAPRTMKLLLEPGHSNAERLAAFGLLVDLSGRTPGATDYAENENPLEKFVYMLDGNCHSKGGFNWNSELVPSVQYWGFKEIDNSLQRDVSPDVWTDVQRAGTRLLGQLGDGDFVNCVAMHPWKGNDARTVAQAIVRSARQKDQSAAGQRVAFLPQ